MKTYKLIKTYPGSPCFGSIETPNMYGMVTNTLHYTNMQNYTEFWEEIVKKDYEILSVVLHDNYNNIHDVFNGKVNGYGLDRILQETDHHIYSIKRLSDSKIFTIGDKVIPGGNIIEFYFVESIIMYKTSTNANAGLNVMRKRQNEKLFTTEDGVDIFVSDMYSYVNSLLLTYHVKAYYNHTVKEGTKMFSTEKKAKEYVLMNKKSLSPNDILKVWSDLSGHTYKSLMTNSVLMATIIKYLKDEDNKR